MGPITAVIAMGEMGAGIAKQLVAAGARARTSLRGRGKDSAARAKDAGVENFDDDRRMLEGADFFLSIVPPGSALALAERLAPSLAAIDKKPIYVDCNAVSPATVKAVASTVTAAGCRVADCGILGLAPAPKRPAPRIFLSGPAANEVLRLKDFGLDLRVIDDEIGKASALKCAYAALGKGVSAIGAAMILGAHRWGVNAVLQQELAAHQPQMWQWLSRQLPDIYPKAYRWIGEMEEIGQFLESTQGGQTIFHGIAQLFERFACANVDRNGPDNEVEIVESFRRAMQRLAAEAD